MRVVLLTTLDPIQLPVLGRCSVPHFNSEVRLDIVSELNNNKLKPSACRDCRRACEKKEQDQVVRNDRSTVQRAT